MPETGCNYQRKVTLKQISTALAEGRCHRCGITSRALMDKGQLLEICGEDFGCDLTTGETINATIALCPECHRKNHLDVRNRHNPCHVKARRSHEEF